MICKEIIFVLLALLVHSSKCQYDADVCMTPDGQIGSCIILTQCGPLYRELVTAPPSQRIAVQRKLLSYQCGYEGASPKVCCSSTTSNTIPSSSSTSSPPIIRPPLTPNPSTGGVYSEPPPDVSRHQNLYLLSSDCGSSEGNKIFGGNKTSIFDYTWMALLSYRSRQNRLSFECGGSILNERYILTAAHCLTELRRGQSLAGVRVGEHDTSTPEDCEGTNPRTCAPPFQDLQVEEVIPHPGYRFATKHDDIGLIRVATPIRFVENTEAICLPTTRELLNARMEGDEGTVTGWGYTETNEASPDLLKVDLPIMTNERCGGIYNVSAGSRIGFKQMCAGGIEGRDSCGGDSGGPLVILKDVDVTQKFVQYGVVSFGPVRCGTVNRPGVYTRIPYYMDWILDRLRP